MSKILIYSQEDLDLILELEKQENEELQQENKQLKIQISAREEVCNRLEDNWNKLNQKYLNAVADYEKTMFEKEQLKKQLEEKDKPQIFIDTQNIEERYAEGLYQDYLEEENKKYKDQQKEFINYLEDEKDRLARECSQIYEDSLGKTRLVNEDIFNEVNDILRKYKDIIGDNK